METKEKTATDIAGRELKVTRLINASKELVFEAWTNPEHISTAYRT